MVENQNQTKRYEGYFLHELVKKMMYNIAHQYRIFLVNNIAHQYKIFT